MEYLQQGLERFKQEHGSEARRPGVRPDMLTRCRRRLSIPRRRRSK